MNRIRALVKRGWQAIIWADSQGHFNVEFSHSTWGDVSGYGETLDAAVNVAYKAAKKLEIK